MAKILQHFFRRVHKNLSVSKSVPWQWNLEEIFCHCSGECKYIFIARRSWRIFSRKGKKVENAFSEIILRATFMFMFVFFIFIFCYLLAVLLLSDVFARASSRLAAADKVTARWLMTEVIS